MNKVKNKNDIDQEMSTYSILLLEFQQKGGKTDIFYLKNNLYFTNNFQNLTWRLDLA